MLYIGSCRYMKGYPWAYFPARLHSTREIIFFLENIDNIRQIVSESPSELTNFIFGDIYHPKIKEDSINFMDKNINKNINKIILEICSRKVRYYTNIPLSHFYSQKSNIIARYDLVEKILTDDEIDYDLAYITKICKKIFNETIEVHIIPHLNLKTKLNNKYIYERNNFVKLLEQICNKYNINIHNIGKYIESISNDGPFIEDYMSDSRHYSKGYELVKAFLISKITAV